MKSTERVERVISEQWPTLKKKAQNETDPERLVAVLEEIDDLLFSLEVIIAAQDGIARSRSKADSRSASHGSFYRIPPGDSEIGSQ